MESKNSDAIAAYFDALAPDWDTMVNRSNPLQPAIVRIAGLGEDDRVLDLGCGTGIMVGPYLEAGVGSVVGIDISEQMIEHACANHEDKPNVSFICGDVLDYDAPDPFDAVVMYNCYPHFLDKEKLVQKVAGFLKPGGRFVVAHAMGRETMNKHHETVPHEVTSVLLPATESCKIWEDLFDIDTLVDSPGFYCFAGSLKKDE